MKRLHLLLALLTILTVPVVAWGIGKLEPMMGTPFGQFTTSTVTAVDAQILAVPGFLQCIMISQADAAPTAGSITIYDSATEANKVLFTHTFTTAVFMPFQICPQVNLTAGLYIGMNGPADIDVIVSYR